MMEILFAIFIGAPILGIIGFVILHTIAMIDQKINKK